MAIAFWISDPYISEEHIEGVASNLVWGGTLTLTLYENHILCNLVISNFDFFYEHPQSYYI